MADIMIIKLPEGETLNRRTLQKFGEQFLSELAREIKKDVARRGDEKGDGIPDSLEFVRSFKYKILKDGLAISCSWPWIEPILEGKKPFKMLWLTKQRGVRFVPFVKKGRVEIRSTPATIGKAWVHPGVARHTFIQRAFNTVAKGIAQIIAKEQSSELAQMVADSISK